MTDDDRHQSHGQPGLPGEPWRGDTAHFERPEQIDLERRNAASHLGYSSGTHYCLGAPLARRELYWGFKAFIDNVEDFRLAPGHNNLRHYPNYAP